MGNKVASMEWFVFMALTGLWLAKTIRLSAQSASHSGKNEGDKDEELVVLELSVPPVWPCREDGSDAAVVLAKCECHVVIKVVEEFIRVFLQLDIP